MGIMTSGSFADLHSKDFSKIFLQTFSAQTPIYTDIFNIMNSERQYEKLSGVTSLGLVPKKVEGQEYTVTEMKQKYDKTFTHDTFAYAVRITNENYSDDLSGSFKKIPALMAKGLNDTIETECALMFDRSQNSSYTGADSKVLCATDHPLLGGGTFSNRPTDNADLTLAALEDGYISMQSVVDDNNIPMKIQPRYVMVHSNNSINLAKILESPETLTQDKIKNILAVKGLVPIYNPYLTDTDGWYIISEKDYHQMCFFWREKPNSKMDTDTLTDDAIFKIRARWSKGWVDPRGVFGSVGA